MGLLTIYADTKKIVETCLCDTDMSKRPCRTLMILFVCSDTDSQEAVNETSSISEPNLSCKLVTEQEELGELRFSLDHDLKHSLQFKFQIKFHFQMCHLFSKAEASSFNCLTYQTHQGKRKFSMFLEKLD